MKEPPITLAQALEYEARNSIASWISWSWAQNIMARYLASKVRRKMGRYFKSRQLEGEAQAIRDSIR